MGDNLPVVNVWGPQLGPDGPAAAPRPLERQLARQPSTGCLFPEGSFRHRNERRLASPSPAKGAERARQINPATPGAEGRSPLGLHPFAATRGDRCHAHVPAPRGDEEGATRQRAPRKLSVSDEGPVAPPPPAGDSGVPPSTQRSLHRHP
jgi:hypothetical protein